MGKILFALLLSIASSGNAQNTYDLNKYVWPSKVINVCWERSAAAFKNEKVWVEQAVKETWGKESGVDFACWCDCKSNSDGIRIAVDDIRPTTNGKLGKQLDKQPNGLVLNFTYRKTQIPIGIRDKFHIEELDFQTVKPATEPERKRFIKATAVHEFGHALGLSHQHDRDDCSFKDCFFDNNAAVKGALWFTPCDEYSVMNYCSNAYLNDGYLSELDAIAIRTLYPYSKNLQNKSLYIAYTNNADTIKYKLDKEDLSHSPVQRNPREYKILANNIVVYLSGNPQLLKNIVTVRFRPHGTTLKETTVAGHQNLYYQAYKGIWGSFTERVDVTFKDGSTTVLTKVIDPEISYVDGKVKTPFFQKKTSKNQSFR